MRLCGILPLVLLFSLALDFVCSEHYTRLVELGSQLSARPLALGGSKVYACLYPQYVCAENQGRADGLAVRLCQAGPVQHDMHMHMHMYMCMCMHMCHEA